MVAYAIQFRRGTTAESNSFTGLEGEIVLDTEKKTLVVHDGSTVGGKAVPTFDDLITDVSQLQDSTGVLGTILSEIHNGTPVEPTVQVSTESAPTGSVLAWGGDRGITAGRDSDVIDTFNVSTAGNSTTGFGTLTSSSRYRYFSLSNATRTVFSGVENSGRMEYITNATGGAAEILGTLQSARRRAGGASDGTAGLFIGGEGYSSRIDKITVDTAGDSTLFGSLYSAEYGNVTGNSTYAINWGGFNYWEMQYITYATGGTATQWGTSVTTAQYGVGTVSNETYGVTRYNTSMEYCTFDTLGSVATFGTLTENIGETYGGASNGTTGVWVGASSNVGGDMKYITIDTQGNAADFGDFTGNREYPATSAGNLA